MTPTERLAAVVADYEAPPSMVERLRDVVDEFHKTETALDRVIAVCDKAEARGGGEVWLIHPSDIRTALAVARAVNGERP